jgi:hypothetical protein
MFCAKQKMTTKICNKINVLLSGFSENAYVMLFNHSMEVFLSFKMLASVFTKSAAAELFLPLELKFRRIVTFEQQSFFV